MAFARAWLPFFECQMGIQHVDALQQFYVGLVELCAHARDVDDMAPLLDTLSQVHLRPCVCVCFSVDSLVRV
jgi:hypothetical protein